MIELLAAASIAGAGGFALGMLSRSSRAVDSPAATSVAGPALPIASREVDQLRRENEALRRAIGVVAPPVADAPAAARWGCDQAPLRMRIMGELYADRTVVSAVMLNRSGLPVAEPLAAADWLSGIGCALLQVLPMGFREARLRDPVGRHVRMVALGGALRDEWLLIETGGAPAAESLVGRVRLMSGTDVRLFAPEDSGRRVAAPGWSGDLPRGLRAVVEEVGIQQLLVLADRQAVVAAGTGALVPDLTPLARCIRYVRCIESDSFGPLESLGVLTAEGRWLGLVAAEAAGEEWLVFSEGPQPHSEHDERLRRAVLACAWDEEARAQLSAVRNRTGSGIPTGEVLGQGGAA